ncbi:MAG: DeoR/GlpR transcriptional regulator [Clostridia bacterium]|jgi:DeoR/GlpR family transcriptional regulator of sugar metabolism|nr:DeoR/GlpR transcriptional regulator [Clostridia bacterium]
MLAIERRNQILEQLQREKRVVVSELSAFFGVSEETIRRDLEKLSEDGFVVKTYGGAVLNEDNVVDLPFVIRKNTNVTEKQSIGKLVAAMTQDGEHLMLDSSSTAASAARYLKTKNNLTIITNSVEALIELSEVSGFNIISTGGVLKEGTLSLTGAQVDRSFASYNVDTAVFSCKGIDKAAGITDSNETNAHFKQTLLSAARRKILAIDHTKFDKTALVRICRLGELTHVVTDQKPNDDWLAALAEAGVACVYPKDAADGSAGR